MAIEKTKTCGNCAMLNRDSVGYAIKGECAYLGVKVNLKKIVLVDGKDCKYYAPLVQIINGK